jgi:phenylacetic acid degradation operon negative regulatory protein
VLDDGGRRIFSFGATPAPWDGMWSLVAFSIPEEHRSARDELRKELRWLGFAPLYDGLWVCPRDHAGDVMARLKDLGISTATAFRATALPAVTAAGAVGAVGAVGAAAADGAGGALVTADIPARAWDLSGLRDRYQEFTEFAGLLRDQTVAGEITTADALVARTRVMNEWRAFPAMDPDLPYELLPPAWPRAAARDLFITCYDLLGPLAARRVRQIIARYSPELAGRAAYHSSQLTLADADD